MGWFIHFVVSTSLSHIRPSELSAQHLPCNSRHPLLFGIVAFYPLTLAEIMLITLKHNIFTYPCFIQAAVRLGNGSPPVQAGEVKDHLT